MLPAFDRLLSAPRTPIAPTDAPPAVQQGWLDVAGAKRVVQRFEVDGVSYFEILVTLTGRDELTGRAVSNTSGQLLDAQGSELATMDETDGLVTFAPTPDELERSVKLSALANSLFTRAALRSATVRAQRVVLPEPLRADVSPDVSGYSFSFEGLRYWAVVEPEDDDFLVTVFDTRLRPMGCSALGDGPLELQEVGQTRPWSRPLSNVHRSDGFEATATKPRASPVSASSGRAQLVALAASARR